MSNTGLQPEQRRFIDDFAARLMPWGMQPGTASLYAYLLLCDEPVSLDAIAEVLGMAKSTVSVGARALEQFGLARRHTEPGSKRLRYAASEAFSGFLVTQAHLLDDIGRMTSARAGDVATGETLCRLRYLGSFYRKMGAAITGRIAELQDEYQAHGPDEDLK